ncbi:hypothetical protein [Hymenobacter norwichensis]|uniref:hypothetical protein n=1 Tax=Hymenobacter norwichensis TaxID=223903 RepID=UPI0012F8D091|nr:hypothetical protein [Hymenobacter norwichensis]
MSDYSISIIPKKSSYPNRKEKATEILEWLVHKNIINSDPSDCTLGSKFGYAISEEAKRITCFPNELPFSLITNGLDIITERQVFDTCQYGLDECICPNCKENIASEDWSFFNDWHEQKSNNLTCPLCNIATDIHQFTFSPEWGFSDLGFTFWNWPDLTDDFIEEFSHKLGCDVSIVYTYI